MALLTNRVKSFLDDRGIPYEVIHHPVDFTAQETAADTHTPGREFAKVVVVRADERFAMLVMPAHHRIDFAKARKMLGARDVRLASEAELQSLFPDCEIGAEPPFGPLYDLATWISAPMTEDRFLTFNAGTHQDVIRMTWSDFVGVAEPRVGDFTAAS